MAAGNQLSATVIVASDRAAQGVYQDRSGALLDELLTDAGWQVRQVVVVPDGDAVGEAIAEALDSAPDLIVTTGGTGVGPRDRTPEQTKPLLDRQLPHVASAIVQRGLEAGVPTAALSRGLCGVAGHTLVVNLPGSSGAVRDGVSVLLGVAEHVISQVAGGDHQ